MIQLFRPPAVLPVTAYTTYQIAAPLSTHWRPATCAEVGCGAYRHGWRTPVDPTTDKGAAQAYYIRSVSGRRFVEDRDESGRLVFTFEPGQQCFTQHQQPLEREPIYLRRGGDWRGNPTGEQLVHRRPEHWVEDFTEHQQRLVDRINQG